MFVFAPRMHSCAPLQPCTDPIHIHTQHTPPTPRARPHVPLLLFYTSPVWPSRTQTQHPPSRARFRPRASSAPRPCLAARAGSLPPRPATPTPTPTQTHTAPIPHHCDASRLHAPPRTRPASPTPPSPTAQPAPLTAPSVPPLSPPADYPAVRHTNERARADSDTHSHARGRRAALAETPLLRVYGVGMGAVGDGRDVRDGGRRGGW